MTEGCSTSRKKERKMRKGGEKKSPDTRQSDRASSVANAHRGATHTWLNREDRESDRTAACGTEGRDDARAIAPARSLARSAALACSLARTPGKIAESRTRIKNHRPCPVASLLVPRRGASVLPNRIHHNWHEKTYERANERTRSDRRTDTHTHRRTDRLSNWRTETGRENYTAHEREKQ